MIMLQNLVIFVLVMKDFIMFKIIVKLKDQPLHVNHVITHVKHAMVEVLPVF